MDLFDGSASVQHTERNGKEIGSQVRGIGCVSACVKA